MPSTLVWKDTDDFYKELLAMEAQRQEYEIDTGIREVAKLPLRLLHHIGMTKEEIGYKQHKAVEESDFMLDFVEPLVTKVNEMIGRYKPARDYEFRVEAEDFDTIKIHGRPQSVAVAA
ncbi:MAG: hypothetical protein ACKV2V_18345 [Blastocatellia bacterium]